MGGGAVRRAGTPDATGSTGTTCANVIFLAPPVFAALSRKGPLSDRRAPEPFSRTVERLAFGCGRESDARPAPLPESCHWRVEDCRSPEGFADLGKPNNQQHQVQSIR